VADDAAMGWARYAHSMRVFVFNSGLFYIRPTPAALDLLDRIALRLAAENGWDQAIFNEVRRTRPVAQRAGAPGALRVGAGAHVPAMSYPSDVLDPTLAMCWAAARYARPQSGAAEPSGAEGGAPGA
jgi:hypothetical protein